MKIHQLTLFARSLEEQEWFYIDHLGFKGNRSEDQLHIYAGSTELIFKERTNAPYYHFAFLIPKGQLQEAILFAQNKQLELLLYKNDPVIDFGTGKAIYFYDPSRNIVEFIDRPSLKRSSNEPFSAKGVVCINEIGLPHTFPLSEAEAFLERFGIVPLDRSRFDDDFCWVGNFEGTFLLVKIGRNWLPTSLPAIPNDFDIVFETESGLQEASFRYE